MMRITERERARDVIAMGGDWDEAMACADIGTMASTKRSVISEQSGFAGNEKNFCSANASSRILLIYYKIMYSKIRFPGTNQPG